MKTTIDKDGKLVVKPESILEAYALKHWLDESTTFSHSVSFNCNILNCRNLIIETGYDEEDL